MLAEHHEPNYKINQSLRKEHFTFADTFAVLSQFGIPLDPSWYAILVYVKPFSTRNNIPHIICLAYCTKPVRSVYEPMPVWLS